jgi:hypothetical protein
MKTFSDLDLDAVAVELHFMNQRSPDGTLWTDDASPGSTNPG